MFLRLNIRYTVIKLVCLVLCFKPFKIPFPVSCGLYRDNERNKKTDLSCCKIQPGEIPWFRCPLQTAPVRTDGFFLPRNGCNIAPGTDPAPEAVMEDFRNFGQRFSGADFFPSSDGTICMSCRYAKICMNTTALIHIADL